MKYETVFDEDKNFQNIMKVISEFFINFKKIIMLKQRLVGWIKNKKIE